MSDISIATLQARAMRVELERDSARAELAECQRQAAAMRSILNVVYLWCTTDNPSDIDGDAVAEVLQSDAGRGWVKSDELDALTADNRKLRELLRRCEWGGKSSYAVYNACPICGHAFEHRQDCHLASALKEEK